MRVRVPPWAPNKTGRFILLVLFGMLASDSKPTPNNMPVACCECGRLWRRLERVPLAGCESRGKRSPSLGTKSEPCLAGRFLICFKNGLQYTQFMQEFLPFFLVVFVGVFISMVFRRVHVPWVVGLILGGMLVGPHALDILPISPTVDFLGQLGLIFLMFMAGLETRLDQFKKFEKELVWLAFINGAVPFITGIILAFLFGYGLLSALLVGIIFVSSSIAIVIPSLEQFKLLDTRLGQSVVMTTVLQDIASLILLSIVLQSVSPVTSLPLVIFYPLVIGLLFLARYLIPKIEAFFIQTSHRGKDLFQQEFRATLLILIGMVIGFELLGLHPIIAGFFAGLILSDTIKEDGLKDKIRTISYGIFIPVFFIIVGAQTDLDVFLDFSNMIGLVAAIILGSVLSKLVSGWIGARFVGFNSDQSMLFAISSVPQLSTTLAVAFASLTLGVIDQRLITAMVALSIVTVIVSPALLNIFGRRIKASISK